MYKYYINYILVIKLQFIITTIQICLDSFELQKCLEIIIMSKYVFKK